MGDEQLRNEGRTDDIRGEGPMILGGHTFDIGGDGHLS